MSQITLPNTLTNGNPADATQVMGDLNAIVNVVNGNIDDSNIVSSAAISPSKISGTAVTQNYLGSFTFRNILYNPFFYGPSSTAVWNWTLNTNATATYNDSTVTSGVNSITDSNAADTWVIQQTINTSLNTTTNYGSDVLLVPGKQYIVMMDVKTSSGSSSVFIAVQNAASYAGGNTNIQSTTVYHPGSGAYSKIYSVFTVPAACQNITIALVKPANTTAVTVSDAGMTLGNIPVPINGGIHELTNGGYVHDVDNLGGWIPVGETWTYASSNTVTTPIDVTSRYSIGDKVKFTQSATTKYFYITGLSVASGTTTITLNGGTDYTVANAVITNISYSKVASPQGHPIWFNYTPTYGGTGSMTYGTVTTNQSQFSILGRVVYYRINASGTTGGVASGGLTTTLPVNRADTTNAAAIGGGYIFNGSVTIAAFTEANNTSQSTIATYRYDQASLPLTSGVVLAIEGFYNI